MPAQRQPRTHEQRVASIELASTTGVWRFIFRRRNGDFPVDRDGKMITITTARAASRKVAGACARASVAVRARLSSTALFMDAWAPDDAEARAIDERYAMDPRRG